MRNIGRKAAWLLLMMCMVLSSFAKGDQARMMVHLLDYLAVDYSMAVQNGTVINQAEYQEMKEFAQTISEMGADAPGAIQSDVILLRELVNDRASQEKISSVATSIKQKVISHYKLEIAPKRWPSLESGAKLYALHCRNCHGASGKGNGPLSADLEPKPTNFHSPAKANGLSPFQAYNTIRLGVDGTAMREFNELNDDEVWDLAFYVLSLPFADNKISRDESLELKEPVELSTLASLNNEELREKLKISKEDKDMVIAALRKYPKDVAEANQGDYLEKAKRLLAKSLEAYEKGDASGARNLALTAYLEGVEPVEMQLRANDASFAASLEGQMGKMRTAIEKRKAVPVVQGETQKSLEMLGEAQEVMTKREFSGWLSFLLSFSIILREGLEAFLVVVTILGIIRALKMPGAANWVHAGWLSAIGFGVVLWLAADRFFTFSGAQREVMEGAIALFAVGVLLYVGFWMHSKSEAGKWQAYVKSKIQVMARKENMLGLAFLSFLVVFREAFESVLFLSALNLEVGEAHKMAFGGGIVAAFGLLGVISVLLLRYSRKIPVTQLFKYSALIISFLALILAGKGIHALQEAGIISINMFPINLRIELVGIYPTWESAVTQLVTLALIIFLWRIGNRKLKKPLCETHPAQAKEQNARVGARKAV